MKHHHVTAAIFQKEDVFLALQRGHSKYDYIAYKYEFPGGKVEPGESKTCTLTRELKEELNVDFEVEDHMYFMTIHHTYPDFKITMDVYLLKVGTLVFDLNEHIAFKWLSKDQLDAVDWAEADLPIVDKIKNL